MPSSGEIVTAFIDALVRKDLDAALELVTDDFVFENVPMPASALVRGKEQLRARMTGLLAASDQIEWQIVHQLESEDAVINERVDVFTFREGMFDEPRTATRACGVWELRDGKIAAWRDYYDLKTGFLDQVGVDLPEFGRRVGTAASYRLD